MRKKFLFAATGAMYLMLASCSADEPVAKNTSDGLINYSVVAANQSRAAHSYCANNMPDGFRVWAKYNDNIYIDGDSIEKSGEGKYLDVTGSRFWPAAEDARLSFYAVADGNFVTTDGSKPVLFYDGKPVVKNYKIKDAVKDQLDLMYAVKVGVTDNPVQLNFRHALSQVCFMAYNESPTTRITVKGVTVGGLYNEGTYTLPSTSTDNNITDHGTSATGERTHGEWTGETGNASYDITVPGEDNNGIVLSNTPQYLNVTFKEDHKDMDWSKVLNLLPQKKEAATITENTAPSGDTGAYFKLTLVVENISKDESGNDVPVKVHKDDFELYIGADIDWKEGNRYIYTFKFSGDWSPANLKAIEYEVTSDDFVNVDPEPYPIICGHEAVLMRKADAENGVAPLYVAKMNIGATNPYDAGLYFWWGDIDGHKVGDGFDFAGRNNDILTTNHEENADFEDYTIAKLAEKGYVKSYQHGSETRGVLTPERDAACRQWGGFWRLPTIEDLDWLKDKDNCDWTWQEKDEAKGIETGGFKVRSKSTGGEIFLPLTGYINDTTLYHVNSDLFYWSSTAKDESSNKWYRAFRQKVTKNSNDGAVFDDTPQGHRWDGFPIRPVANTIIGGSPAQP